MNISFAARLLALQLVACTTAAASETWDLGVHGSAAIGDTGAVVLIDTGGNVYTNASGAQIGPFTRVIGPGDSLPGEVGSVTSIGNAVLLPNANIVALACCWFAPGSQTPYHGLFSIAPSGGVQLLVDGLTPRPGTTGTFLDPVTVAPSYPFAAFRANVSSGGEAAYTVDLRQMGDRPQLTEIIEVDTQPGVDNPHVEDVSVNNAGTAAYLHRFLVYGGNGPGTIQEYDRVEIKPISGPSLTVATTGDPAPNGRTYLSMGVGPSTLSVNASGVLAFSTFLSGPDIDGYGIGIFLRDASGNLSYVYDPLEGVPGRPGQQFLTLQGIRLLPDGTVIFAATYDPVNQVPGVYRVRPPYSSIEVIFDAADPVLLNGQTTSLFGYPSSDPFQSCTWAQAQADWQAQTYPMCSYMGSVSFAPGRQFANDTGSVTFSIDTPQPQALGPSVFASFANPATTSSGSGVSVNEAVTLPDGTVSTTAQITFDSVQTPGVTTVTAATAPSGGATQAPTGFEFGSSPVYYDVSTTASFTGSVTLCFSWQEGEFSNESSVKLFHYENGAWQDVTTSVDTTANVVCGAVTSLSPFALVQKSYTFSGFFQPVDSPPIVNVAKAGSAIPIKFSLHGNQGLGIFSAGSPASEQIACDSNSPSVMTETVTAGGSSLSYDPSSDTYTYVWKTDKTWAQTCRRLLVNFNDRSQYTADFSFTK